LFNLCGKLQQKRILPKTAVTTTALKNTPISLDLTYPLPYMRIILIEGEATINLVTKTPESNKNNNFLSGYWKL